MKAVPTVGSIASQDDPRSDEDESGVELETEDAQEIITDPFDPEQIRVRTVPIVIEQLVSRIRHDEIDLAPDFQRLRGIWDVKQKSRLIESLLLRIPLPVFYVAADETENWAVVDGVQRMSTMYDYMNNVFALTQLEYLNWLDGHEHDALPRRLQRRISETQLVVNVIDPGTPPEVMFNIFLRINTGGLRLNGQEIRHALHLGPVRDYLKELAQSDEFLRATDNSIRETRMADRECVLRFLAFHIAPWEEYTSNDLDGYLGHTMKKINAMGASNRNQFAADFRKAMSAAVDVFGDTAFRKRTADNDRRRPVSKALFEAWSVQLARCSLEQINTLVTRRRDVQQRFVRLIMEDAEFENSISYSTGSPRRVQKRFEAIQQLVEELI